MKRFLMCLIFVLCICGLANASIVNLIAPPDNAKTDTFKWVRHVDATYGNDSNNGATAQEAFKTLNANVANPSYSADGIYVWVHPGDYNETVSLGTFKGRTFAGTSTAARIITDGAHTPTILAASSDTTLANLTLNTLTYGTSHGLMANSVDRLSIVNCDIFGASNGFYFDDCNGTFIEGCRVYGVTCAMSVSRGSGIIQNCYLETNGGASGTSSTIGFNANAGYYSASNMVIRARLKATATGYVAGIRGAVSMNIGALTIENFVLDINANSTMSGPVYGVYLNRADSQITLRNGTIRIDAPGASAKYSMYAPLGKIVYENVSFSDPVSGNVYAVDPNYPLSLIPDVNNNIQTGLRRVKSAATLAN